jgi:hypothetical protein
MILKTGDMFRDRRPNTILIVTANGTINSEGNLVMGRGAALQLKQEFPGDVDSRSDRAGEAGSQMRMVANSLDKYIGNKKLEGDELTEIQEIVDLLNEHAEELEQVSFPGMY